MFYIRPHPIIRHFKRHILIMGRIRSLCRLSTSLYLSLFYQLLFFYLDAFKQDRCRFIIRVLRYEFTMNGKI